ncbi:MAG: ABC transporter permease [Chloroflexi bacterium]|nr:ABC transporter permease [Chloroflexota bacterium]
MSSIAEKRTSETGRSPLLKVLDTLGMPALAMLLAFVGGAITIGITSGSAETVLTAYAGMINGAFFKTRGFSETLVAMTPYIWLGLGLAVGFKAGLFNIGVEGQFYIGAISAVWAGITFTGLPAIVSLPLGMLAGALGGAIWAGIPGILKAKTGAHEVITTMMMNYIAFRFAEYVVSDPLRDRKSTAVQTLRVSPTAELWSLWSIPERLADPLNALGVAIFFAVIALVIARWLLSSGNLAKRFATVSQKRLATWGIGLGFGVLVFFMLPPLTKAWWPFSDQYDRLHIGVIIGIAVAAAVWWLMYKTTLGFEMRTVGANPDAAKYAGINISRNIIVTMAISGALAGVAGTIEVLGVSICRCLPLFFSSGYGFDSIALALLAKNNPIGIVFGSFLFGAMRNGADLMELNSGVSKYIISLIQGLVLLFVAAPSMVRYLLRMRAARKPEEEAVLTRGWGA